MSAPFVTELGFGRKTGARDGSVPTEGTPWIRVADGRVVSIGRASQGDEQFMQRFVRSLSAHSRHQRFFHPLRELTPSMLERMVQPDERLGAVLLAFAGPAHAEVVGLAQYDIVEPGQAEVAVVVGESWRRVGLATRLLCRLEVLATAAGIVEARAEILRENPAALALLQQIGYVVDTSARDLYTLHVVKRMMVRSRYSFRQALQRC
ncbi:MAG TPA: GNAT family N-acetyltransferase [Burkholderiales bacterium]|nr:GNAT family N-acetyltransferase [Burkholderiales bacterium]